MIVDIVYNIVYTVNVEWAGLCNFMVAESISKDNMILNGDLDGKKRTE